MNGTFSRVVAAVSIVALVSSCAITTKQRQVATYGTIGVALIGVGVYMQAGLATCPVDLHGNDQCEEDRHDRKNIGGVMALGGLVAVIVAQLWPVTDEAAEKRPELVMAPPPPVSPDAAKLHDPAALQLADNARNFAASGKCMEAFGSLKALRRIDIALADQLDAWDPGIAQCRAADLSTGAAYDATPSPSGPPSQTAPTTTP